MNDKLQFWRVVPASIPGTSHEKRGVPCQDAHYWKRLPNGILVAAVADGAGSATHAEVGSRVATQTAVELVGTKAQALGWQFDDRNWPELIQHILKLTQDAIAAEAAAREVQIRELATTLILVVATPDAIASAQVGDGAIVVNTPENELIAITSPQQGEYANETTFLVSPQALETAQIQLWKGHASHLAIFSDGLQRLALKFPEVQPFPPFFSPLFRFITEMKDEASAKDELIQFLRNPRIAERTDDDLTILLATLT